jgi:hypothetical protein
VRSIVREVLVGQTQHGYTYAQAPLKGHAIPATGRHVSGRSSELDHDTLDLHMVRDHSMLADDATRQKDLDGMRV